MKCQPKANNNREAVVVCARHVVKRPSKRMRASITEYENDRVQCLDLDVKFNSFIDN